MDTKEIELINLLIRESVAHGGDAGGAYFSNTNSLLNTIENYLEYKGIKDQYEVITTLIDPYGCKCEIPPRIVKKDTELICKEFFWGF